MRPSSSTWPSPAARWPHLSGGVRWLAVFLPWPLLAGLFAAWDYLGMFWWAIVYPAILLSGRLAGRDVGRVTALAAVVFYQGLRSRNGPPVIPDDLAEWLRVTVATLLGLAIIEVQHIYRRSLFRSASAAEQTAAALAMVADSEARFRAVVEQAPIGIVMVDADQNSIVQANARYSEISGLVPSEVPNGGWATVTHPDDRPEEQRLMQALKDGAIDQFTMDKRYARPDGSVTWARVHVKMARSDTRRVLVELVEDITERKLQEEAMRAQKVELERALAELQHVNTNLESIVETRTAQLTAANAAKSEFLANMSHEIRTPLNAVIGLAQVLERERLSPDQRDMVQRIRIAGRSLLALLNDILDLSKIEAGQLTLEKRSFSLFQVCEHLERLLGESARAKGLTLSLPPAPAFTGGLVGDPLRLEQVLLNLVGNAIKFTPRGQVTVTSSVLEETAHAVRLRVEVRDTGIGIPPDALARLFSPFSQGDGSIARRFGGTGLGLAICKRLVEMMGGAIGVDSTVGVGTRIWFELPFQRAEWQPVVAAPVVPGGATSRLAGRRILVVDDSRMNLDVVERALRLEGAAASTATDGTEALNCLRTDPFAFDAVLMDVQMPVMDGLTATRAIRNDRRLSDLPVIALTAGVLKGQQEEALAAGVVAFLPKPLDLEQMVATLQSVFLGAPAPQEAAAAPSASRALPLTDRIPVVPGIDVARVAHAFDGDADFFMDLLSRFTADLEPALDRIEGALAKGDHDTVARQLHRLRGSAGTVGALALAETTTRFEQAIVAGGTGAADERDAFFGQAFDLARAVRAVLASREHPDGRLSPPAQ